MFTFNKNQIWKNTSISPYHVKTSESGLHSDIYLNSDTITSDPILVEEIITSVFLPQFQSDGTQPDWVITYPPYGMALGYSLAHKIWAKFGYINRKEMTCSFDIYEWQKVLLIADDIYTWGNIKDMIGILKQKKVVIMNPIFSIANFWKMTSIENLDIYSIFSATANLYTQENCPMCQHWSIAITPRENWKLLISTPH